MEDIGRGTDMAYSLEKDGDGYEQQYYHKFIKAEFPGYDAFWSKFVVPLTNRPANIHAKTDSQLAAIGKGEHDICISQLHYTILRHLARVYEIRQVVPLGIDLLVEGIVRITGAQDVAFELLERYTSPRAYHTWVDKATGKQKGSREARNAWQTREKNPLQEIRDYRNHLVHGRVSPAIVVGGVLHIPAISQERKYYDWRKVTAQRITPSVVASDFSTPKAILDDAWHQTIQYFEQSWRKHLL